jgi:hypothetical protein
LVACKSCIKKKTPHPVSPSRRSKSSGHLLAAAESTRAHSDDEAAPVDAEPVRRIIQGVRDSAQKGTFFFFHFFSPLRNRLYRVNVSTTLSMQYEPESNLT